MTNQEFLLIMDKLKTHDRNFEAGSARMDKVDEKLALLLEFRWKIAGMVLTLTALFNIVALFLKK